MSRRSFAQRSKLRKDALRPPTGLSGKGEINSQLSDREELALLADPGWRPPEVMPHGGDKYMPAEDGGVIFSG